MWFDKLTTNGINKLPFVLSLSKDLIGVSLRLAAQMLGISLSSLYRKFDEPEREGLVPSSVRRLNRRDGLHDWLPRSVSRKS